METGPINLRVLKLVAPICGNIMDDIVEHIMEVVEPQIDEWTAKASETGYVENLKPNILVLLTYRSNQ